MAGTRYGLFILAVTVSVLAWAAGGTPTLANQGAPGNQGPWPVTISGGGSSTLTFDGGYIGQVATKPCSVLRQTNDAGVGTSPTPVPAGGPLANRIWIQICNDSLNGSSAVCKCSSSTCPTAAVVGAIGDALATGDCATYNMTGADAGVPCCVCNGAGVFLPSTECAP